MISREGHSGIPTRAAVVLTATAAFVLLSCALPDQPVVPCSAPSVDTTGWTRQVIQHAGATILLPSGMSPTDPDPDHQWWMMHDSELMTQVHRTEGEVPMALEDITLPLSLTAGRTECQLSIDGHTGKLVSYFELTQTPHLGQSYVAALSLELVPGSWLNIGAISEDAAGQARMLSAFRTVRVPDGWTGRSPPPCPPSTVDTAAWRPIRIESAPVTFLAPPGSMARAGYSTEVWWVGSIRVDFVPLGTRTWKFDPARTAELWCRMERGGREIELQVVRTHPTTLPNSATVRAYIRLSTDSVLHVYGWVLDETDGPEILRTIMSTIRP